MLAFFVDLFVLKGYDYLSKDSVNIIQFPDWTDERKETEQYE